MIVLLAVVGLGLGSVFVQCAGPVRATVAGVGSDLHTGWSAALLTASFAAGVAIPLLLAALAGRSPATRMRTALAHAAASRRVLGAVPLVAAVVLASSPPGGIQRSVPGDSDGPTTHIEANSSATRALAGVMGLPVGGSPACCTDASPVLQECGPAPIGLADTMSSGPSVDMAEVGA